MSRLYRSALIAAILCGAGGTALAGAYLVTGGTVTQVANTSGNNPAFVVLVTGGTSNTCPATWIIFSQADAPDAATFQRAYAAAMVALTTGVSVSIYNYADATCNHASYLQLGP